MPDLTDHDTSIEQRNARYYKCSVLLFDPQTDSRYQTADALSALGIRNIHDARDVTMVQRAYQGGNYDLMIGDTGSVQGSMCELVRKLRHNAFGGDPFLGVILTTWSPTQANIRRAANTGPDHLLAKPCTPDQVRARVNAIIDKRKGFVVTLNYIGPDRRSDNVRAADPDVITVPNALRAKVRNDLSAMATPDAIKSAMAQINRRKISRCDHEIGILIELILRSFERGDPAIRRAPRFRTLLFLINDLDARVRSTGFARASAACAALARLVKSISALESTSDPRLEELWEIGMTLHLCFNPGKDREDIVAELRAAAGRIERRTIISTAA